jgi:hypothetical protein
MTGRFLLFFLDIFTLPAFSFLSGLVLILRMVHQRGVFFNKKLPWTAGDSTKGRTIQVHPAGRRRFLFCGGRVMFVIYLNDTPPARPMDDG